MNMRAFPSPIHLIALWPRLRGVGCSAVRFLPLLLLYEIVILLTSSGVPEGDEPRYLMFARNLANGYFCSRDAVNLWNGPGYPLLLLPFEMLKIPWLFARMLNGVLLFLAVLYFYATLRLYLERRPALWFSYLMLGLYLPFFRDLHVLLTEPLAMFLACGLLFHFCKMHQQEAARTRNLLFASAFMGYLALTKIFFGHVITFCLFLSVVILLIGRRRTDLYSFLVCFAGVGLCIPWLLYTHSLTGKVLYWGSSGGSSLYWMSSPFEQECGDWKYSPKIPENPELARNHQAFLKSIEGHSQIEQDDALKQKAIENITQHPSKYFRNWLANVGRLLFNYPFSYAPQSLRTYFYLVPNMFVVVLSVLCFFPAVLRYRRYPYEICASLLFGAIVFTESSVVSAFNRQFWPVLPPLCLWISFTLNRVLKIEVQI